MKQGLGGVDRNEAPSAEKDRVKFAASDQPIHSRLGRAVSPAKLFDRQRPAPGRTGGYCNRSFSSSPKRAPMRLYVSHGDNRVVED